MTLKAAPPKKKCHDGELRKCAIFSIGPPALVRSNGDVSLQHYRRAYAAEFLDSVNGF